MCGCQAKDSPPSAKVDERQFFEDWLLKLPTAQDGEFPTPESVARAYFEGLLQSRIADTFKCMPLRALYDSSTFESDVSRLMIYSADIASPEDGYTRFMKVLNTHCRAAQVLRYMLLAQLDSAALKALQSKTDAPDKDGKVDTEWLANMAELVSFKKLAAYRIASVEAQPPRGRPKRFHGIEVADVRQVKVVLEAGDVRSPQELVVVKVATNYQVIFFPFLPK
jgi:hypothetical protein